MFEGLFFGIAGGSAILLAQKACGLCRSSGSRNKTSDHSGRTISSFFTDCWSGTVQSTRDLFAECRAELEATRVAVEEVRNPSSGKVVRIY